MYTAWSRGEGASASTVPLADAGTCWSSRERDTGLRQPGRMTLPAMHGAPLLSVNGAPVIGLVGLRSCVPRLLKSPLRCAVVGTMVWLDPASARSHSR